MSGLIFYSSFSSLIFIFTFGHALWHGRSLFPNQEWSPCPSIIFLKNFCKFILAVLGLRCCSSLFFLPLCLQQGGASCGAWASHCRGFSCCRAWALGQMAYSHYSSQALEHRLCSCSKACGIFPDQGSNPCPLYWKEDSLPLSHQGSTNILFSLLMVLFCSFHFGNYILWVGWRGGTFGFGSMVHSKTLKQWFWGDGSFWYHSV